MTTPLIDLTVEDEGWNGALPDLAVVARAAAIEAIAAVGQAPEAFTISLLACSDDRVRGLNADFRDKASPTNVLSWPSHDLAPEVAGEMPLPPPAALTPGENPLGDVAIALQTCLREAENAGIPLKNHVTHLILHGCLHLLGFDHQTDADADLMEGIESRILTKLGIPDPYE